MILNLLNRFEAMDDVGRISAIEALLLANGAERIEKTSRGRKDLINIFYISPNMPYVFVVIIHNGKGYHNFTLIDYDVYDSLVVNQNQIFRAAQCHHKKKWSIQYGAANIRLHDYVLPDAKNVDHITGHKSLNTRDVLRPCTPQQNMKNVLRYCVVDKNNNSFTIKDTFTTPEDRLRLGLKGFECKTLTKGAYIHSPEYKTLSDCYAVVNQFEQHYFGEFAFNPLMNYEDTWHAFVLQKMIGDFTELELQDYNRDYWKRRRPEDARYYML